MNDYMRWVALAVGLVFAWRSLSTMHDIYAVAPSVRQDRVVRATLMMIVAALCTVIYLYTGGE